MGADRKARVDLCGCRAPSRWRCERCTEAGAEHLACSRSCLEKHWCKRHGRTHEPSIGARTRHQQALQNDAGESNWHSFAGHRARVTGLLRTLQRGEGLCVLGAGNGDDLDLGALVREFGEVHLVDLDGAALERAQARAPAPFASSVVLHGDVDLTGLLDGIERWGDDDRALFARAEEVAAAVAARLGRTFDVVLSSCVLSQLCAPFTRVLARRPEEWRALMALVGRTHFQLMARLLRPGGTGVALGDIYYGPAAAHAATALTWASLDRRAQAALRDAVMRLRDLVAGARLSEPWLWQVEQAAMLVYAVIFQRS